jgi:D-lactate dehydrogenase (cytochrome)
VIDDASQPGAAAKLKLVRAMATTCGGREVSPSAPRTLRGTPFTNFNVPERRTPVRNLPIHGLIPHSRTQAVAEDVYAFLREHKAEMDRLGIACGVIFFAVGVQALCIEPLVYWSDEEHFLHNRVEEVSDVAALDGYGERSEATLKAFELRDQLKVLFRRHGAIHMQIGRAYPWRQTRDAATLRLLTAVKDAVDPRRLVNRGSLGFGAPGQD